MSKKKTKLVATLALVGIVSSMLSVGIISLISKNNINDEKDNIIKNDPVIETINDVVKSKVEDINENKETKKEINIDSIVVDEILNEAANKK